MIAQGESAPPDRNAGPEGTAAARFDGRQAFTDALRSGLLGLHGLQVPEFWMVDLDFAGWPLDEPAVLDSITAWIRRAGRRLHMVAADFEAVERHHPRFAGWRRDYVHGLSAWRPESPPTGSPDGLLLIGPQVIELVDRERWQVRVVSDPVAVRAAIERVEATIRRCEPAWPVAPLGL